jgi:methylase of polypeptide subunit release factors
MARPGNSRWELVIALDGGPDGFDIYRRIIAEAHKYLVTGGSIVSRLAQIWLRTS